MSWFDRLKFWKKETDLELPSFDVPKPTHLSGVLDPQEGMRLDEKFPVPKVDFQQSPSAFPSFQSPQQFQQPVRPDYSQSDRQDLVLARLDTIKAQLDNVLQRLERLEKERRW